MTALSRRLSHAGSLPTQQAVPAYRQSDSLWLALQLLDPLPDSVALLSLADWAGSLTSVVVLRPDEGLLLEVQGSLKYFAGLAAIRRRLEQELRRRGLAYRLATAPTPLAATWLVRYLNADITDWSELAGTVGSLPLAVTAWPDRIQLMLGQMGLKSLADCLRLPRAGFVRRIGQAWLDELDRALGRKPDPRSAYQTPETLCRTVEFATETMDQVIFTATLESMVMGFERELRQKQKQLHQIELEFRHLRSDPGRTQIRFVDPVHQRDRILGPLLARLERLSLSEPAIAISLRAGVLVPLKLDVPELLAGTTAAASVARSVPEFALVECLRGRFGSSHVYGIDRVAEHRPEYAWQRWVDRPVKNTRSGAEKEPCCSSHGRPLWLLPEPRKRARMSFAQGESDSFAVSEPERIESGWWDGQEVRRDYHVVVGSSGEKLWFYRDRVTRDWYLHGIFG